MSILRILLLVAFLVPETTFAKLPGQTCLVINGGYAFNGIGSKGTPFVGRTVAIGLGYTVMADSRIGLQMSASFQIAAYRHFFDKTVFVEHVQKGISADLLEVTAINKHLRMLIGIHVFVPYKAVVDMGQRDYNRTYFFSNDSLINRYKRAPFQAGAVVSFDYGFGKRPVVYAGLRFDLAGISPVKQNAVYRDANGGEITISTKMRPASVQVYLVVHIGSGKKKQELNE